MFFDQIGSVGSQFNALAQKASSGFSLASSVPTLGSDVPGLVSQQVDGLTGQVLSGAQNAASNAFGALKQNMDLFGDSSMIREFGSNSGVTAGLSGTQQNSDLRIRLAAMDGKESTVYGDYSDTNILSLLHDTRGMMFPFTPQIEWAQAVEYTPTSLTHSNQEYFSYKNTPSTNLNVTGEFAIQNYREGQYMLACIHFLRTVSKMYFGVQSGSMAGMPPPVLKFSGYGNFMFNDLPVIVRNHAYSLPKDVDYLDIKTAGGVARLPSLMTISLSLTVQNTPRAQREDFNLDKFRTGEMMTKNKGWI